MKDLQIELQRLAAQGCYPWLSMRGFTNGHQRWRARVNGAGNYWGEGRTPLTALKKAVACWKKNGCPMDGYVASVESQGVLHG